MASPPKTPASDLTASDIDVVLFDYGQVLSAPPDPAAWSRMLTITALGDAELHEAYWKFRHDYDRNALGGRTYWQNVAQHAKIQLDAEQVNALLAADVDLWAQPNPSMIGWAGRLQRAHRRTAILSNIGDAMAEGVTARLAWLGGFERCIWSYALNLAKPEIEIFQVTATLLKTPSRRVLFIDDKKENVDAARESGMQAIRYSTQAEFERKMRARGLAYLIETGTDG